MRNEKNYERVARATGLVFSWATHYTMSAPNEYGLYLQNTDPSLTLNIQSLSLSATQNGYFTTHAVTGTAAGSTVIGVGWNGEQPRTASANAKNGGVLGLTSIATPSYLRVGANLPTELFDVDGAFKIASGGAVAFSFSVVADVEINVVGYYE